MTFNTSLLLDLSMLVIDFNPSPNQLGERQKFIATK